MFITSINIHILIFALYLNYITSNKYNLPESVQNFHSQEFLFNSENLSENFIRTQNGWNYGNEKIKAEYMSILPGYLKEHTNGIQLRPASRSCNVNRDDVDELAERVFLLQLEIPEISIDISWSRICEFVISIIDSKSLFLNNCKLSGITHLLSRPVNKLLEQSIIKLCKSMPQYLSCTGSDDALDSLAEDLMSQLLPHLPSNVKKSLSFSHFCFVSTRSIQSRTREEYMSICINSIMLISNLKEVAGSHVTHSIAEDICKSTWVFKTECNGFPEVKIMSNLAFEFFTLIRNEGIPNVKLIDICNFLTKISPTIRVLTNSNDESYSIIGNKKYLYECTMYLTPLIEHEKIEYRTENHVLGDLTTFYPREAILDYFHKKAKLICESVNLKSKKRAKFKKLFVPCLKKKIKEIRHGESILDLFTNLMYSIKLISRRKLGWAIQLPFPGSEESKAMLLLGYSLNTANVGSMQNPQYIRMLAILQSKKYILPKTAYEIWKEAVLSIGVEILPSFNPSMTPEIISRPIKDVVDLKIHCGNNDEDVDALALEILSTFHENNLTNTKFLQFCPAAEFLVGVRNEDFFSSCVEALKYIPELDSSDRPSGRNIELPKSKVSKLCREMPRWKSTASGISYASLVVQDTLGKKYDSYSTPKPLTDKFTLSENDIYSYVIKTATRAALERSAATEQVCKQLNPIYTEENIDQHRKIDVHKIQEAANQLFRKAVSLIEEDKQLSFLLSGNTLKGSQPITFESFCSLVSALSKVEKKYYNVECARNLRLMFRQNVIIQGKVRLATIKSRTVAKICMSSPYFEKCSNQSNSDIDEISFDLLMGAQKLRFTSVTYRHLCGVVKNIRRAEIKSLIPKGQRQNTNISSFFNSDCVYGLRTLSIGARHAEIICSGTRFWVMCGNYIDSEVDALASQLYADIVQNTALARFMTVELFELVDFCPIAQALIHEIDYRYFNRECVNALAAISISKEYAKSICQSSRHWQGTCSGTIEEQSSIIERIDPIAGALYKSAQDLGYLEINFVDFCDSAKEIFNIKEVTETGQVLEGHDTSIFHLDCPRIVGRMLQSLSEEYASGLEVIRKDSKMFETISAENHEKSEMICQNFYNHYDPNYGASQFEEYAEANLRNEMIKSENLHIKKAEVTKDNNFLLGKSHNQRMAGSNYYGASHRYNWAKLLGQRVFVPSNDLGGLNSNIMHKKRKSHIMDDDIKYLPQGLQTVKEFQESHKKGNYVNEDFLANWNG